LPGGALPTRSSTLGSNTLGTERERAAQRRFEELKQRAGWGDPRPANVSVDKLINLNYQIGGGKPFDLWIDDLKFLECKK
jgi:hypothetical protein